MLLCPLSLRLAVPPCRFTWRFARLPDPAAAPWPARTRNSCSAGPSASSALARRNGYLATTADSIAVYHTSLLLAQTAQSPAPDALRFPRRGRHLPGEGPHAEEAQRRTPVRGPARRRPHAARSASRRCRRWPRMFTSASLPLEAQPPGDQHPAALLDYPRAAGACCPAPTCCGSCATCCTASRCPADHGRADAGTACRRRSRGTSTSARIRRR